MSDLRLIKWFGGNDTGLSSKAIAMHMSTGDCEGDYPHDPADLGRCLRLLVIFPEWVPRMTEMGKYGPVWAELAFRWSDLETSMADECGIDWSKALSAPLTYELMHQIEADGWRKDVRYDCSFGANGHLVSARLRKVA